MKILMRQWRRPHTSCAANALYDWRNLAAANRGCKFSTCREAPAGDVRGDPQIALMIEGQIVRTSQPALWAAGQEDFEAERLALRVVVVFHEPHELAIEVAVLFVVRQRDIDRAVGGMNFTV